MKTMNPMIKLSFFAIAASMFVACGPSKAEIDEKAAKDAIASGKAPDTTYYNLGFAKCNTEDYQGAITNFTKVIELNPKYEWAYILRGRSKYALNDYQAALPDFSKVIELDSKYPIAYFDRANCKDKLGDKTGACEDWKKADELGFAPAKNALSQSCK
ncbi:MAG TPA: tetratricopeptide repeat protein [Bacteroidia bacterium]